MAPAAWRSRVCRLLFWQAGRGQQAGRGGRGGAQPPRPCPQDGAQSCTCTHAPSMHHPCWASRDRQGLHPIPHASPTQQGRSPSSGGCTGLRLSPRPPGCLARSHNTLLSAPLPDNRTWQVWGEEESPAPRREAQGGGQGEGAAGSGGLFVSDPRAWGAEAWGG